MPFPRAAAGERETARGAGGPVSELVSAAMRVVEGLGGDVPKPEPRPGPDAPRSTPLLQTDRVPAWQHALREAFARPADLLTYLQIDPRLPSLNLDRLADFPLRVPRGFASRMRKRDPRDPLFLQVWPSARESDSAPGFLRDAVGDLDAASGSGVIHKYRGRVLLIATGACAVHCRYCFRRHFPYSELLAARERWRPALEHIAADPSIHEVILSGGDPLSLSDERLSELFAGVQAIAHVKRLRIHSRQPVVLPERVDGGLLKILRRLTLNKVMVLHVNHAREVDGAVVAACRALREAGLTLLNQSVLLAGVNDSVEALQDLHERLFDIGVLPYYLHVLDRVDGAAHFEVSEERAGDLMRALAARSPGYLVPRLAREVPGEPAKTLLPW